MNSSDAATDDSVDRELVVDLTEDERAPLLAHIAVAQVAAIEREDPWNEKAFRVRRKRAGRH